MNQLQKFLFQNQKIIVPVLLILVIITLYYKLFAFGKIPFPGDLLISSYSPWFDFYKMPVQNPIISDVFSQLYLWKTISLDSLKMGQWPLWNPYSLMGTPLLANYQSATVYPLNLLFFFSKHFGWGLYIFSQTIIATIGMYLFLSLFVESKIARIAGSIIFALGGLMTTWLELGTAVSGMAWLPLCLFCIEKYHQTSKLRYPLLLTIFLSLTILSGTAQITTYVFLICFSFTIVCLFPKNLKLSIKKMSVILISLFGSFSLTSLQLIPSYDLLTHSVRLSDNYIKDNNFGLLPLKHLLTFFNADFFGNPVTRNYFGFLNYFETSNFIGSITLAPFLYTTFFLNRNKYVRYFLGILLLSLLLVFDNPLSQLIYHQNIPLLTLSYASRMLFVTIFAISVLTAFSLNQIIKKFHFNILGTLILVSLSLHLITLAFIYLGKDSLQENFNVAFRNSIFPLIFTAPLAVGFVGLKFLKISPNKKTLLLSSLLVTLLILDLGRFFLKFNPFISPNLMYPETPTLTFLQNQPGLFRIGREHAEVLPPNTWTAYGLQTYEGYDPLYNKDYADFFHYLNSGNFQGTTGRYAELSGKYSSTFLDAANVKYFLAIGRDKEGRIPGDQIPFQFKEAGYKIVNRSKSSFILENPRAAPRAYFAKSLKVQSIQEIQQELLKNPNFDPKTQALITKDLGLTNLTGEGEISITGYSSNYVSIKTHSASEQLLVLSDQFDPGWQAKIDNHPTPIAQTNLIFRSVKVPAGTHLITFNYQPNSFRIGLTITEVTILIWLGLLGFGRYKRIY